METEINVNFIHPTDGRIINVTVDDSLLAIEAIAELIAHEFIPANPQGYKLTFKKEGRELDNNKSMLENAVPNNATIRVQPATDAGGGGFEYFVNLWQTIYPYLDQVGTVLCIAGASIGFGAWIKDKFEKSYTPKQFIEIIMDKEFWNAHELALKLDITDDESKSLLKGFGYKWDRRFSLYYKTDKTVEILEKIQNIE